MEIHFEQESVHRGKAEESGVIAVSWSGRPEGVASKLYI